MEVPAGMNIFGKKKTAEKSATTTEPTQVADDGWSQRPDFDLNEYYKDKNDREMRIKELKNRNLPEDNYHDRPYGGGHNGWH